MKNDGRLKFLKKGAPNVFALLYFPQGPLNAPGDLGFGEIQLLRYVCDMGGALPSVVNCKTRLPFSSREKKGLTIGNSDMFNLAMSLK